MSIAHTDTHRYLVLHGICMRNTAPFTVLQHTSEVSGILSSQCVRRLPNSDSRQILQFISALRYSIRAILLLSIHSKKSSAAHP